LEVKGRERERIGRIIRTITSLVKGQRANREHQTTIVTKKQNKQKTNN